MTKKTSTRYSPEVRERAVRMAFEYQHEHASQWAGSDRSRRSSAARRRRCEAAYLGLVPRRYQSGEIDYVGSISKCGDRRLRTLLYEAANVLLTRFQGALKLKDWALAIAARSNMRRARVALARRLAVIMHAMLRHGTSYSPAA